jgi:beta-1,4-mannosyltransferase
MIQADPIVHNSSLNELVKDGKNGLIFTTATELSEQIVTLLTSFPSPHGALNNLRSSLRESSHAPPPPKAVADDDGDEGDDRWVWNSWSDNWNRVVRPFLLSDANGYQDERVM